MGVSIPGPQVQEVKLATEARLVVQAAGFGEVDKNVSNVEDY